LIRAANENHVGAFIREGNENHVGA
jgi:hypothetical protein